MRAASPYVPGKSVTLHLHWLDLVAVLGSLFLVFGAGLRGIGRPGKEDASAVDYILAGRSLTLPLFVCTMIATWYGAPLGAGEFVYTNGLVMIFCLGVPYYLAAIGYALFMARRIRSSPALSIPEQIRVHYGDRAGMIASLLVLVFTVPASYILMVGTFVQAFTGWPLVVALVISTVASLAYVLKGGLRSDVQANVVQTVLMFLGFFVLLAGCIVWWGSPVQMWERLPETHRTLPGVPGWQPVVVWWIIALQTFVDPNFHMRTAAAVSPKVAQRGILVSVSLWVVFDLLQLTTGLYAKAYMSISDPVQTYIVLSDTILPAIGKGVFVAGVLAAIMSTLDGYALVSANTIGHDIIDRLRGRASASVARASSIRWGLLVTGIAGIAAALLVPSVISLLYLAASIAIPGLLIPLICSYFPIRSRIGPLILPLMVVPVFSGLAWRWWGSADLDPMIVGLGASLCMIAVISMVRHERQA